MRKKMLYTLIALIALVSVGLVMTACNKGGDNNPVSGPDAYTPQQPVASNPTTPAAPPKAVEGSGVCAGKTVYATDNGAIGFCVLETNFSVPVSGLETCQLIDPSKTNRVFKKIGIVSAKGGYTRTAIYADNENKCGATAANPGADPDNNQKSFKDGDVITLFRNISPEACGREQWDGDLRDGTNRVDVLGYVLNYPKPCPSCEVADLQLTITGEGLTRTVKVTFKGEKANKKATVNFGDGNTAQLTNGGSVDHTWAYGTFTVTATLDVGAPAPCSATQTVSNNQPNCSEYKPPVITGDIGVVPGPASYTFNKGTVAPDGGAFNPTLPQSVERPDYGQPAGSFSTTYTVPYGPENLKCSVSKPFTKPVPPKDPSCKDLPPPPITGDISSDVQTTQVVFDKGTVGPSGGTFNPTLPKTVVRPNPGDPAGSFSTTYTYVYNTDLQCKVSKEFTKPVPPQDEKKECKLSISKDVDLSSAKPGDTLKYSLTIVNDGTGDCTGGGVKIDDDVPANVEYVGSSGTVGQCTWQGPVHWNCGVVHPGASITVSWKGKVKNPAENCNDFTIKNKATAWSVEKGTVTSNEVSTSVDVTCDPCLTTPAPVVTVSCTPNPYYDQSVECTATSSVPAKFDWDRDALAASTVASCSTTDKKTYSKSQLDNKSWKISVTATACDECKKTGSKSVDLIVNPPVGACYYKVSGESEAEKEITCTNTKGGYTPVFGIWLNFDHGSLSNHCMFPVNGLSNNKFQLTPGQSDPSCLNKND